LAAISLSAVMSLGVATPAYAATTGVSVGDGSAEFSPGQVTVRVGDTVRWSNTSLVNAHNVSSSGGGWSFGADLAPVLSPASSSASFTFSSGGTYAYVCRFHPAMRGIVVVTGGSSTQPTRAPAPQPTAAPKPTATRIASPAPSSAAPTPTPAGPPAATRPSPSAARAKSSPAVSRRPRAVAAGSQRPTGPQGLLRGLTAADPTGRERGLPLLVALAVLVGVGSAHVRVRRLLPVSNGRHRLSPDRSRRRRSVGRGT
jgi:plastocyanin